MQNLSTTTIGVIGAGTMGYGIAQLLLQNNHQVLLYDKSKSALATAKTKIYNNLNKLVNKSKITTTELAIYTENLFLIDDLSGFNNTGLIIEAIIEDLAAKQDLFKQLEAICSPQTVFATNTSTISINAIASTLKYPNRLLGMHFFNPAPIMKLVEIVYGLLSAPKIVDAIKTLAINWGKQVVTCKSTPGFIVNRIARPFYAEALEILETSQLSPAVIDHILKDNLQFKMGPFELMDLIGNDVNYRNTTSVFAAMYFDKRYKPSLIQQEYVEAGLLGCKSNKGFYDYQLDKPIPAEVLSLYVGKSVINTQLQLSYYQPNHQANNQTSQPDNLFSSLLANFLIHDNLRVSELKQSILSDDSIAYLQIKDTIFTIYSAKLVEFILPEPQLSVVYLDWAYDYKLVKYLNCHSNKPLSLASNSLFAQVGINLVSLPNLPGLINARTLAMLINEAADILWYQVCSQQDADKAIVYGLNYPRGLLAWGEIIGWARIKIIIDAMEDFYQQERYRVSPWIKQQLLSTN